MTTPSQLKNSQLKIGAVNYLNSKPLVYGLADRLPEAQIRYGLPSHLADWLTARHFDVALIPSVELFRHDSFRRISNACVASRGEVMSVKLYFRTPPAEVRTLALDEGSRTSAALCQLLLENRYGIRPVKLPLPIGYGTAETEADAVLLIGDRAMAPPAESFVHEWDLGAEWYESTGLPFVFACWVASPQFFMRDSRQTDGVAAALEAARDAGIASFRAIAEREGPPLGVSAAGAQRYFEDHLHFQLGPDENRSMRKFRSECQRLGLLNSAGIPAA